LARVEKERSEHLFGTDWCWTWWVVFVLFFFFFGCGQLCVWVVKL